MCSQLFGPICERHKFVKCTDSLLRPNGCLEHIVPNSSLCINYVYLLPKKKREFRIYRYNKSGFIGCVFENPLNSLKIKLKLTISQRMLQSYKTWAAQPFYPIIDKKILLCDICVKYSAHIYIYSYK